MRWLTIALTVLGCGNSGGSLSLPESPADPEFSVAIAVQPGTAVALDTTVILDGTVHAEASNPSLAYHWLLREAPTGSEAKPSSVFARGTSFVADLSGAYVFLLTATDGVRTSRPAFVSIVAGAQPISVSLPAKWYVETRNAVSFNLRDSFSQDSRPLQFVWTLRSAPAGSAATLTHPVPEAAAFTPDVDGEYVLGVEVSTAGSRNRASTRVIAASRPPMVAFRPTEVRFSRTLDVAVALSTSPAQLHLFEPTTQHDQAIALPGAPRGLALSGDGLYAAVGYDGAVSYVDLQAGTILKTWPISVAAASLVLSDEIAVGGGSKRFVYVFPGGNGQSVAIRSLDLTTGDVAQYGSIFGGTQAVFQGSPTRLFGAVNSTASLTPLYRFTLANGLPIATDAAFFTNNTPVYGNAWLSIDGQYVLTGAGTRFRTNDLTEAGHITLFAGYPYALPVAWADSSVAQHKWVLQRPRSTAYQDYPNDDASFWTVDAESLSGSVQVPYPRFSSGSTEDMHGRYVFFDNAGRVVYVAEVPIPFSESSFVIQRRPL